jgi:hypothetical protein
MIRNVTRILILLACCVLGSSMDRIARAQSVKIEADPWYYQCDSWAPPPWDKKGVRRLLFPAPLIIGEYPGALTVGGKTIKGKFLVRKEAVISLISEPLGVEPTQQFITSWGAPLDFIAPDSPVPVKARIGRLFVLPPEYMGYYFECLKGDSATALLASRETPRSLADVAKPSKPAEPEHKLADVFSGAPPAERGEAPRADAGSPKPGDEARAADKGKPAADSPSGLRDVFTPASPPPPGAAPARPDTAAPAEKTPRSRSDAIALALRNLETAKAKDTTTPASVCEFRTLTPLPVANGTVPASLQEVGFRNTRVEAHGFDYSGSDARPLDGNLDIADSASKLVRYEAIAASPRSGTELISFPGTDESHLRRNRTPAKTLTMLVVAGPAELAMSGLDLVGNELRRPGAAPVDLDIEWHAIDESGALKFAGRYPSLEALVRDAAAKGRGAPDLLGEAQLQVLFNGFETLLKSHTATVEKVFWIKGPYPIPSSIPQRFERFLRTVSDSSAVLHTPSGKPTKWLQIISARTAGFSIAYLKEPINAQAVGDVFEEAPGTVSGPRRLIGAEDASVLASNLRAALILASAMAKGGAEPPPPERETLAGKLVLDAREVFEQRGYLFSAQAAEALRNHLARVAGLWEGPVLRPDVLAALADETGKPSPSIADILQVAAHYPQLPKTVPDWFGKPIRYLTPAESSAAKNAIAAYAKGANWLAEMIRNSATGTRASCGLFYIADAYFGFDRFQRPPAGRRGPKTR